MVSVIANSHCITFFFFQMRLAPFSRRFFSSSANDLASGIIDGSRLAMSRTLSLVESTRKIDTQKASDVLRLLSESSVGSERRGKSMRIGITGPPGAGKSTLIEALGMRFVEEEKKRVAVFSVDPSSSMTGGSILADKTRMVKLGFRDDCFIRPCASGGVMGGVTNSTHNAMQVAEYAGYNVVIVETVGVGQSEYLVESLCDVLMLVLPPASGDQMQGIKRGIMELSDIIVINKYDGRFKQSASLAASNYRVAVSLLPRKHENWKPRVLRVSSKEPPYGMDKLIRTFNEFYAVCGENLVDLRMKKSWQLVWHLIGMETLRAVKQNINVKAILPHLKGEMKQSGKGVDEIVQEILSASKKE